MPKKYSECGYLYSLGAFCVLFLMRTMVKVPCKKRVVRTKQDTDCCLITLFVYFFARMGQALRGSQQHRPTSRVHNTI